MERVAIAKMLLRARTRQTPFKIEWASNIPGRLNFKKASTPIPIEAAPIVMSTMAIRMSTILRETRPKHTPLAMGKSLQNFGSLSSSFKSLPVISNGLF